MKVSALSKIIGYVIYAISCVFSVELFIRFASTGIDKLTWSALAIAFMTAEFLFSLVALRLYLHKKFGFSALFTLMFCVLYVISVAGSLGFQSTTSTDAEKVANLSDEKKILMENSLAKIDQEIMMAEKQAEEFSKKGYYTKGVKPTMERIDNLNEKREEVYTALMVYEPKNSSADKFWEQLASFTGSEDPESVKFAVFLLISLMVDLTGACCVVLGFSTFRRFVETDPTESEFFGIQTHPDIRESMNGIPTREIYAFQNSGGYQPFRDSGADPERYPERPAGKFPERTPERVNPDDDKDDMGYGQPEPAKLQKSARKIGFSFPDNPKPEPKTGLPGDALELTGDASERYIKAAFATRRKKGHFMARRYIAEKAGITQRESDAIHSMLKELGLVEIVESKTIPRAEIDEMISRIRQAR